MGELLRVAAPSSLQAPVGGGASSQGRDPRGWAAIHTQDRLARLVAGRKQVSTKAKEKIICMGLKIPLPLGLSSSEPLNLSPPKNRVKLL